MGGFSDFKRNQALKPPIKYGSRMPPVRICGRRSHSWNHQSEQHFHEGNEELQSLKHRANGMVIPEA